MDIRRCFEILELERGASTDEAKQAYKDIVNVWHPDRFSNNPRLKKKAEERLKEANAAYETVESFLSSKQEVEPEQKEAAQAKIEAEARDKTEAVAEAGTRVVLSLWSYLSKTIRQIIDRQVSKIGEDAGLGPREPNQSQRQGRGRGRGQGKGMGRGRGTGRGTGGGGRGRS